MAALQRSPSGSSLGAVKEVKPWEDCSSIMLRYPGMRGKLLEDKARAQYVKTTNLSKEFFGPHQERLLVRHPLNRRAVKENVEVLKATIRHKGFSSYRRSEIMSIGHPTDPSVELILAGAHAVDAIYELADHEADNEQVLATLRGGLKLTQLHPGTPTDVIEYFKNEANWLNSKAGLGLGRTFAEIIADSGKCFKHWEANPFEQHRAGMTTQEKEHSLWSHHEQLFVGTATNPHMLKKAIEVHKLLAEQGLTAKFEEYVSDACCHSKIKKNDDVIANCAGIAKDLREFGVEGLFLHVLRFAIPTTDDIPYLIEKRKEQALVKSHLLKDFDGVADPPKVAAGSSGTRPRNILQDLKAILTTLKENAQASSSQLRADVIDRLVGQFLTFAFFGKCEMEKLMKSRKTVSFSRYSKARSHLISLLYAYHSLDDAVPREEAEEEYSGAEDQDSSLTADGITLKSMGPTDHGTAQCRLVQEAAFIVMTKKLSDQSYPLDLGEIAKFDGSSAACSKLRRQCGPWSRSVPLFLQSFLTLEWLGDEKEEWNQSVHKFLELVGTTIWKELRGEVVMAVGKLRSALNGGLNMELIHQAHLSTQNFFPKAPGCTYEEWVQQLSRLRLGMLSAMLHDAQNELGFCEVSDEATLNRAFKVCQRFADCKDYLWANPEVALSFDLGTDSSDAKQWSDRWTYVFKGMDSSWFARLQIPSLRFKASLMDESLLVTELEAQGKKLAVLSVKAAKVEAWIEMQCAIVRQQYAAAFQAFLLPKETEAAVLQAVEKAGVGLTTQASWQVGLCYRLPMAGPTMMIFEITGKVQQLLARHYMQHPDKGLQYITSKAMVSTGIKKLSTKVYSTFELEGNSIALGIPGFLKTVPVCSIEPLKGCAIVGSFTLGEDKQQSYHIVAMPIAAQSNHTEECTPGWMVRTVGSLAETPTMDIEHTQFSVQVPGTGTSSSVLVKMSVPSLKSSAKVQPEVDLKGRPKNFLLTRLPFPGEPLLEAKDIQADIAGEQEQAAEKKRSSSEEGKEAITPLRSKRKVAKTMGHLNR